MTELCAIGPAMVRFAGKPVSEPRGLALAPGRRLQPAQPVAHRLLRVLIAFPLVLDFQPRPLVGIERLEIGTAEAAIGRVRRDQQGAIGPAGQRFAMFVNVCRGLDPIVPGLKVGRGGRAGAQCQGRVGGGTERRAARNPPPNVLQNIGHCRFGPLSRSASRKFKILRKQSRLGRRPSIGIMNAKLESAFNG